MDTAGKITLLIKFSPKPGKLLENHREQIKNSEQITSYKITNFYKMGNKSPSST